MCCFFISVILQLWTIINHHGLFWSHFWWENFGQLHWETHRPSGAGRCGLPTRQGGALRVTSPRGKKKVMEGPGTGTSDETWKTHGKKPRNTVYIYIIYTQMWKKHGNRFRELLVGDDLMLPNGTSFWKWHHAQRKIRCLHIPRREMLVIYGDGVETYVSLRGRAEKRCCRAMARCCCFDDICMEYDSIAEIHLYQTNLPHSRL